MKIDHSAFCHLSHNNKWLEWLRCYDDGLYGQFIEQLKHSRGCADNRDIMAVILDGVLVGGGELALRGFLEANFPFMILDRSGLDRVVISELRDYFVADVLTFPRRCVIAGSDLELKIGEFCKDKFECLCLVADDVAFVEFLCFEDVAVCGVVPERSWLLSKYNFSRRIRNG